jgi:hypothetical protein
MTRVGHAKKTRLRGLRFESLRRGPSLYRSLGGANWADTRIHGTTKRQVAAMFAEEQPALGPLPLEPFAITASASLRCTWMDEWRSRPRTTARRRAPRRRAVERPLRAPARSAHRLAPARRPAGLASNRRCRSAATQTAEDRDAARSDHAHRVSGQRDRRTVVPLTPRCRAASSSVRCSRG